MFDLKWVLSRGDRFRYRLLSRMEMDCRYYLSYGNRCPKFLWANNEKEQIEYMKAIWRSFPANGKPQWMTYTEILGYEQAMMEGQADVQKNMLHKKEVY